MNKNHKKGLNVNASEQHCVTHWYYRFLVYSVFCFLPVVEQYIGTFDVSVKEVVFMAVVQTLHQLPHEAADVLM